MRRARVIAAIVGVLIAGYLGYGALLWMAQDRLIFPGAEPITVAELDAAATAVGAEVISLEAADGTALYGWHARASGDRAVLYLHGNASSLADHAEMAQLATAHGWDLAAVAYRGYPGSEGRPSQAGIAQDVGALWTHLTDQGIPADAIVIHGRSLGGGVAAQLAARVPAAGLVLESTFTSMADMARPRAPLLPLSLLLRHPFATERLELTLPMLITHSADDQTIGVAHGRRLAQTFPAATYIETTGHVHSDSLAVVDLRVREAWLGFLDDRVP